jgi:hypothetical protein
MFNQKGIFLMVTLLSLCCNDLSAWQGITRDTFIKSVHADHIYVEDKSLFQDVYFEALNEGKVSLKLESWFYKNERDSIRVYKNISEVAVKKGLNSFTVNLQKGETYLLPSFASAIKRSLIVPCGTYKVIIEIRNDSAVFTKGIQQQCDTLLSSNSGIKNDINNILEGSGGNAFFPAKGVRTVMDKASDILHKNQYRLERYCTKKGLQQQRYTRADKEIIDLFADGWYLGRYELKGTESLSKQLNAQKDALANNFSSLTKNNLGDNQTLLSQFKELKKNSRENSDLTGEISLSGNFSNDQEPNSGQDNNYYEVRGDLEFPLFDIPVNLSGYYTTQDKNRIAKSSYVHFSYDAEKAKEQLLKLISGYNKKYEQVTTLGGSYNMIYGKFIAELQTQKDKAVAGLKQQAGISDLDMNMLNEEQLKQAMMQAADKQKDRLSDSLQDKAMASGAATDVNKKLAQAQAAKQKAEEKYAAALKQYNRIMELERTIKKYQAMLEQYNNTNYYDSLLAYSKSKELQNIEGASYKDIAKKASGLLPESKTKSFITGLTNFDAGMFPKYVSDYTMSGQMLKGLDVGYDIGIAKVGGSYGTMEYIDRTGNVESYKAYSGRAQFKPFMKQTVSLVYYGYSPGKKMLNADGFFKDASVSLPSFRNPVHIISALYSGEVSRFVHVDGEYAISNKQGQSPEASAQSSITDKSAYNIKLQGNIPVQNIEAEAAYEHAGKAFENNTLPVLLAGTDKFHVSGKGDLFHSFLSVGVEYNYLIQSSLSSKGNNSKWGFTIATHSRRYPAVSLSYKPFSTFRSFNDTLNIEQKPILGEVWTGKINYQIKRKDRAIRFTLLYNRNTSSMDTVKYGSALVQFNTIYSYKTTMFSVNVGSTKINTDIVEITYPAFNNTKFINISASGNLLNAFTITGGSDLALANAQIARYGFFVGSGYTFKRMPVMIRANFRFTNYQLSELLPWKQLYSGGLELAWRFKMKLFDKR